MVKKSGRVFDALSWHNSLRNKGYYREVLEYQWEVGFLREKKDADCSTPF